MTELLPAFTHNTAAGTNFGLVPYFEGTGPYKDFDHLLAQLYGGSYRSTIDRPLFAVQVTIAAAGGVEIGKNPDITGNVEQDMHDLSQRGYEEPSPIPGQEAPDGISSTGSRRRRIRPWER